MEGPLGFFRIGWAGGGLDEEGVKLCCASFSCSDAAGCCVLSGSCASEDPVRSDSCILLVWGTYSSGSVQVGDKATGEDALRHTGYGLGGPINGAIVGPVAMSCHSLASSLPLNFRLSLAQTCHQKCSRRHEVGSWNFLYRDVESVYERQYFLIHEQHGEPCVATVLFQSL